MPATKVLIVCPPGAAATHKFCRTCNVDKPKGMFSRNRTSADGLNRRCKPCDKAYQKEYRVRDPEGYLAKVRNRSKRYREKNPEKVRQAYRRWRVKGRDTRKNGELRRAFGISLEDYRKMLAAQNGVCAICKRPETFKLEGKALACLSVDHDHQTGDIRGLLCHKCNRGLGNFEDDPKRLLAAGAYLIRTSGRKE